MILNKGLQQANGNKTTYRIFGHEFVLRDQISNAAKFIEASKFIISEAVKASPEASIAWAGVSILLPLLTNYSVAEEANSDGLAYIISRASYYVQLELILRATHNVAQLQREFEKHIVDLYKHMLEFQVMTVLRLYRGRLSRLARDIGRDEDWEGMLSKVKDLEEMIRKESNNVSIMTSRNNLEDMKKTAEQHYKEMQSLLSVAKQHLQVSEQQRDVASQHLAEHRRTNQILENQRLGLPEVPEARYDSANVQDSPKCEPGTRARIQQVITDWADQDLTEHFYWLVGPAGTGKSTIARTIADSLASQKRLAAGYFFRRGDQGRNDTARFFATLAAQMADTVPHFKSCLRQVLHDQDPSSMEKKGLSFQFDNLLWLPFESFDPVHMGHSNKIIIIDALDECERLDHLPQVLALLSKLCSKHELRVRVLFTSRPTGTIDDAFEPFLEAKTVRRLELQTAFSEDTKSDIHTFLHRKFKDIRKKCKIQQDPWPASEDLDRLVQLATSPKPLFIYAATLCRFVYDGKSGPAKKKLELWLAQCDENKSQLDQMYEPILDQVFLGGYEQNSAQPLLFLHALVILATPVPAASLASLLELDMDDVGWCLLDLHAVLDITSPLNPSEPIRLLHKSFSDFLLGSDETGTSRYRADEREIHHSLAKNCIRRMKLHLKQDICDIQQLGLSRDKIGEGVIREKIPVDLEYACLYWVHHFVRSKRCLDDDDCAFLYEHFLHWLEALSLLGRIPDGGTAIRDLAEFTKEFDQIPEELVDFVQDAGRLITKFGIIIAEAPLQIYASLLLFSPAASKVRQRLWSQRLPANARVEGVRSDWNALLQRIEDGNIGNIAFSPDCRLIAYTAGYPDMTIRLWDVTAGTRQGTLEQPSSNKFIAAIAFSPNGKFLASARDGDFIRVWDLTTRSQKLTLQGSCCLDESILTMVYLRDIAAMSSAGTIRIWDSETGVCQQVYNSKDDDAEEQDASGFHRPVFSPDGRLVAFHRGFGVKLWDLAGSEPQRLSLSGTGPRNDTHSIALSSNLLASISKDRQVRVWNVPAGTIHSTFEVSDFDFVDNGRFSNGFAISPNGQYIACGIAYGGEVQLWNSTTGMRECTIETHCTMVINFSPDGQLVALQSSDPSAEIWSVPLSITKQSQDHRGRVDEIALSPDKRLLAELSSSGTVCLRDASTLSLLKKFTLFQGDGKTTGREFDFSPHKMLKFSRDKLLKPSRDKMLKFSRDQKLLAVYRDTPRAIEVFNLETGMVDRIVDQTNDFNWIEEVVCASDGKLMAAVWNEHEIALFRAGETCHILKPRGRFVYQLAFSFNGQTLASASQTDNTIQLWDTRRGTCLLTIDVPANHTLDSLKFSPDGLYIAAVLEPITFSPQQMTWWDVATGVQVGNLKGRFFFYALSPHTHLLAVQARHRYLEVGDFHKLEIYDLRTVECRRTLESPDSGIRHVVFSPNGLLVAVVRYDATIWLWHTTTGEHLQAFKGHDGHITRIKFSPDGKLIAAVHEKTIWLWSVTTRTRPQIIQLPTGFLREIDFLEDQLVTYMSQDELDWSYGIWGCAETSLQYRTHRIEASPETPLDEAIFELGFNASGSWITRGPTKIIWLPQEYRHNWISIRTYSAIYIPWEERSIVFHIT
ncbi:hypothetical protein B0I35DRAFT_101677 [Stachybotrys elegans]|uniref:NACHT domain-containing protein n=1 Tax=Stachybotrys elegans TaxID=80388 RepID=A0A8K0SKC6_9HYPO|nr:hypothetical protein B0I35DRAFT_101677 [Stachybotrys elegans]